VTVNLTAPTANRLQVPTSFQQVARLARLQFQDYLRSRRLLALAALVLLVGGVSTAIIAYYRASFLSDNLSFYSSWWGGGAGYIVILSAVFFGGDAISGEFQSKTGYFLMALPLRRASVYAGKYLAALLASLGVLSLYFLIILGNGLFYFGLAATPWQLGVSFLLAVAYLLAVLGVAFLFSSLFRTGAYGFILTAVLFLIGFTFLQDLISTSAGVEPWMVISYAQSVIGDVFNPTTGWGLSGAITYGTSTTGPLHARGTIFTPGVSEGALIMIGYFALSAVAGLSLFEREELT
jgi:ABC-2 type transport system permease protein